MEFDRTVLVAVDFDGTLTVSDRFLNPNSPLDENALEWLCEIQGIPGVETILWTCCEGEKLDAIAGELADADINFDYVNCGNGKRPKSDKLNADFYIDDRAYPGKVPWRRLYRKIKRTAKERGWF